MNSPGSSWDSPWLWEGRFPASNNSRAFSPCSRNSSCVTADTRSSSKPEEFGRLDILVNNAAILYDTWQRTLGADLDVVREAIETNALGPWRMCQAFVPLIRSSGRGRIMNVSSGAGSLARMGRGTPAYNVSKAALNALTRMLAAELRGSGILVNSVDPGWTATDMGGHGGRPLEEGAAGVVWAATLPDEGPTGGFFYDCEPEPW